MRKMLLLVLACLCFSNLAFAIAPGEIILSPAETGLDCVFFDEGTGVVDVFVHHGWTTGSTASQFKIEWDPCMTMTYLSETVSPPYISIGSAQSGISIAYTKCQYTVFCIMKLTFFAHGTTSNCCEMRVIADPTATPPGIYVTDCDDPPKLWSSHGTLLFINPTNDCLCDIPVENTTWGQIKSLYK